MKYKKHMARVHKGANNKFSFINTKIIGGFFKKEEILEN